MTAGKNPIHVNMASIAKYFLCLKYLGVTISSSYSSNEDISKKI